MHLQTTEQRYREFLDTLPLSTLRILGRQFGVASASSSHKSGLIDEIVAILTEKVVPGPRTKRGAPAKVTYVDPAILERLNEIKKKGLTPGRIVMEVAQSDERDTTFEDPVHTGLLELTAGGYGFVRAVGAPAAGKEEVYVPAPAVHSLALREGDRVVCTVRRGAKSGVVSLSELLSVNGLPQGSYEGRPLFEELTAVSSVEKIGLSEGGDVSLRLVDLFVPVGKGQRVLVSGEAGTGKTALLRALAREVGAFRRDVELVCLLVGGRPEEKSELSAAIGRGIVISSPFEESAEHHAAAAGLALAHAKRLAEQGKHVVLLIDSLTELAYAYDAQEEKGRLRPGLSAAALGRVKRWFGAGRNTKEAGSLTVIASILTGTGNEADTVLYEALKGAVNAEIVLSRDLARRRIFPAVDLSRSGNRTEEAFLSEEEIRALSLLRAKGTETDAVLRLLRETQTNGAFVRRVTDGAL